MPVAKRLSPVTENDVRQAAVREAKRLGVPHDRKVKRPGCKAGYPDDEFYIPGGRPLLIEFKRPGREATPLQRERIKELRSLGYRVLVIDDPDAARSAILAAVEAARLPSTR